MSGVEMAAGPRYAIYFAPDSGSALWRFGSTVIGYDAATGHDVPSIEPLGITPGDWAEYTAAPRVYGFHATLKAPFYLAGGVGEQELIGAVRSLAARRAACEIARLKLVELAGFLALVNVDGAPELAALASDATVALEPYRAPLSAADLARRKVASLSARQATYLAQFGYPYVLDEFRFHMTLTGSLALQMSGVIRDVLQVVYQQRVKDLACAVDAICVFRQERRDGRFRIIARLPLGRSGPSL